MLVGNVMLLILNLPLVKVFAKVIETPPKYLIPGIIAISVFGVYAVQASLFNLLLMIGSGVAAYFFARHDYPIAPLVFSLILGPLIENDLRRAVNLYNGDYSRFLTDPISLVFLVIAVLWVCILQIMKLRGRKVLVEEGRCVLVSGPRFIVSALDRIDCHARDCISSLGMKLGMPA